MILGKFILILILVIGLGICNLFMYRIKTYWFYLHCSTVMGKHTFCSSYICPAACHFWYGQRSCFSETPSFCYQELHDILIHCTHFRIKYFFPVSYCIDLSISTDIPNHKRPSCHGESAASHSTLWESSMMM